MFHLKIHCSDSTFSLLEQFVFFVLKKNQTFKTIFILDLIL
jgi:hypothetical protein